MHRYHTTIQQHSPPVCPISASSQPPVCRSPTPSQQPGLDSFSIPAVHKHASAANPSRDAWFSFRVFL